MKKLAIGCLILVVVGGVLAAGLAYYAYRQVGSTVAHFAEMAKVADIEKGVRVQGGFTPPASEELTASQVERFMAVQGTVRQRLGDRLAEFERKYKSLSEKQDATLTDVPSIIAAYRDMASSWVDAKRAQVDGLNNAGMSLEEYRWIREKVYEALGTPYMDLDMAKIFENQQSGTAADSPGQIRGAVEPAGPEINRKLVEPHRKQLEASVALASFGL